MTPIRKREGRTPKMGQTELLALVDQGRKYSKIIVFLAIVDILMAIIVLGSWIIMILLLWLIFTADRDRCQRDEDEERQIDRAHLETSTIILYIIQPIFYSMSLTTAIMMAHAIQKILALVLMIWEMYVMFRDYFSYQRQIHLVHFLYYLSTLLETPHDTTTTIMAIFDNDQARRTREYFETRIFIWTLQLFMNALQVFAFIFLLRLVKKSKLESHEKEDKSKSPKNSLGLVLAILVVGISVVSVILRVMPRRIFRMGHVHHDHLMASVVDTIFQFLGLFFLLKFKTKRDVREMQDERERDGEEEESQNVAMED